MFIIIKLVPPNKPKVPPNSGADVNILELALIKGRFVTIAPAVPMIPHIIPKNIENPVLSAKSLNSSFLSDLTFSPFITTSNLSAHSFILGFASRL